MQSIFLSVLEGGGEGGGGRGGRGGGGGRVNHQYYRTINHMMSFLWTIEVTGSICEVNLKVTYTYLIDYPIIVIYEKEKLDRSVYYTGLDTGPSTLDRAHWTVHTRVYILDRVLDRTVID